jgi:hypothetical protein
MYRGFAIDSNSHPLSLDRGNPVTGGYDPQFSATNNSQDVNTTSTVPSNSDIENSPTESTESIESEVNETELIETEMPEQLDIESVANGQPTHRLANRRSDDDFGAGC